MKKEKDILRDITIIPKWITDFRQRSKREDPAKLLEEYTKVISQNAIIKHLIREEIKTLLAGTNPVDFFSQSGILGSKGIFSEAWGRFKHKIIPEMYEKDDPRQVIHAIFNLRSDIHWIQKIPLKKLALFFKEIDVISIFSQNVHSFNPLVSAISKLSHDIVSLGMDSEIKKRLAFKDFFNSVFYKQNEAVNTYFRDNEDCRDHPISDEAYIDIKIWLNQCVDHIRLLRSRKSKFGTSLHLTYLTRRLSQKIKRLGSLLDLYHLQDSETFYRVFSRLSMDLIMAESRQKSVSTLLRDNLDLMAFEIVDHVARKGDKYIANSRSEYWSFLNASMKGGFLIAVFAFIKVWIDKMSLSPLGEGLLFSLNYALCFVLVYLIGGIIATKQPAMTASAVAQSMDTDDDGQMDHLEGLRDLIIKVSRSQFISLVGNLLCALPIAFLLFKAFELIFGYPAFSSSKAEILSQEIHPLQSGALFFACIAGVFLSMAGLFSGYINNKLIYSQIAERLYNHPQLTRFIGPLRLKRIVVYVNENASFLAGNISLGFFLGMAGTIGWITGLPFDIRHVAFSTANFGMVLGADESLLSSSLLTWMVVGILSIGFINFIVSFGFTLFLALKSRKVTFKQTKQLAGLLARYFIKYPWEFFVPPISPSLKLNIDWQTKKNPQ